MNASLVSDMILLAVAAGWTVVFHFVKRTLDGIDRKLEEHRAAARETEERAHAAALRRAEKTDRQLRALAAHLARAHRARAAECRREFVSRQEFGAFTATINHKIDSIYELLKHEERIPGR